MSYSAVIRTKNSSRTIRECIESLLSQSAPPVEIIVVDSGSTDDTLTIVKDFAICKVVHYPNEPFNYSKSLNIGIAEASENLILNFSSHCIFLTPNSTKLMLDFLDGNELAVAVTFGINREREPGQPDDLQNCSYRIVNKVNFKGHAMNNPCALIRKKHWEERPFNEQMERCEDQEWANYWLQKNNYFTVMIDQPSLFYDNQNFDRRKVAKDYMTIGRHFHWYYRSPLFMLRLFVSKDFFYPDRIHNFKLIYTLFYYRYLSRKKY